MWLNRPGLEVHHSPILISHHFLIHLKKAFVLIFTKKLFDIIISSSLITLHPDVYIKQPEIIIMNSAKPGQLYHITRFIYAFLYVGLGLVCLK